MDYYSPLRYPGGKGKVADYFKQIFKDNLLYDGLYVEPYAGGASVALSLLFNEYASQIIINDIDKSIFAFWDSVLNSTDELCKLIRDTPVNVKTWDEQKRIQKEKTRYGLLKVGFSTFYLNRTNRSGILNAGIIGGREQKGNWKIDARYNKKDLINRIERIAQYKDKIKLYNSDAVELIKKLKKNLPTKTLFYFDPPYFVKGKDLYLNYYNSNDHQEIATEIAKLSKHKWIVTYDNVQPIKKLYSPYRQVKYSLNYSAAQASTGKEVMIFSDNLYITKHHILKLNK
jgi:DNA adenine methylase